jgi:hypothetical protein
MTTGQLARLAELAAIAAGHFARTDPPYARRFADAALAAVQLGVNQLAADSAGNDGASLSEIGIGVGAWREGL